MKKKKISPGLKKNQERKTIQIDKDIYIDYQNFLEDLSKRKKMKIILTKRIRELIIWDMENIGNTGVTKRVMRKENFE